MTCDHCRLMGYACPGEDAHCANGDHCTRQDEVCARDLAADDHTERCCGCGEKL